MRFPITHRRLWGFVVMVLATMPTLVAAQRHTPLLPSRPIDGPLPCGDPRIDCTSVPAPATVVRTATAVSASLRRGVVAWEVSQTFTNRGAVAGETEFLFPLPPGAAFDDLRLSINGELVAGEILAADEARRIYEEIVRRSRDPALVEWLGQGLVRTRIFPILPGEQKRVVLRYSQPARREGDALRVDWRQPRGPAAGAEAPTAFTLRLDADASLGRPYSPTHTLRADPAVARTYTADAGSSDLTVLIPARRAREASVAMLTHAPGTGERWAMITLTPPDAAVRRQPRDVTFVLDVSGSMAGRKLEQAKAAGRQLLATLDAGDRLRLIAFSGTVQPWRGGFTPATPAALREATAWLDGLQATGSTNIGDALAAALRPGRGAGGEGRLPLVLFMTDGEPTAGETDAGRLADSARAWRAGARLYTFGLGADVNAALVEQLALDGRGTAQFVRPEESVERAVGLTAQRLSTPLLTDLRLRAEGVRLRHLMPELPIDVFAGQDAVLFAQVEGSGEATLVFSGRGPDGPVAWRQAVRIPASEPGNVFVGKLWATQRAGWLSAERRRHGAHAERDDELRRLGERWGIPTELSSYLVLEPGMQKQRGRLPAAGPASASAPAAMNAVQRFESARRAAAMRSATSMDAANAAQALLPAPGQPQTDATPATPAPAPERLIAGRRLVLVGNTWTQVGIASGSRRTTVTVQPFSTAWFALVHGTPVLRDLLAAGERVRVSSADVVLVVAPTGVATLSPAELERVVRAFAR